MKTYSASPARPRQRRAAAQLERTARSAPTVQASNQRDAAQRQRFDSAFGAPSGSTAQCAGLEDELQMKVDPPLQRAQDEELLQGRFDAIQRVEEENPLQGRFDTAAPAAPAATPTAIPTATLNRTGMPDGLKSGIESMSGMDLSDVRVHANSDAPAQIDALAYAQGNDIHLAPGQEQHLPHEAWHVVQQRQGRVQPTLQMAGVGVNDDVALESEADVMGAKALQTKTRGRS